MPELSGNVPILLLGLVVVTVLSRIIAAKIRSNLGAKWSPFTYLFVALLAIYYLIDIIRNNSLFFHNIYFYFWVVIITIQLCFYFLAYRKLHDK